MLYFPELFLGGLFRIEVKNKFLAAVNVGEDVVLLFDAKPGKVKASLLFQLSI